LPAPSFENSVFINCPFDKDFEAILQAIIFCIIYNGLSPRIATERNNSGESRLEKIIELIEGSKFSIHDLSRCQSRKAREISRLNMPFELGLDYSCKKYCAHAADKKILILEEKSYRYQAALSDIAGFDIQVHSGNFEQAVRKVRNWLVSDAGIVADGTARIIGAYADFQAWYFDKQLAAGFSEEDIRDYPTIELLEAMKEWISLGRPIS
jgi:hypothetical protein